MLLHLNPKALKMYGKQQKQGLTLLCHCHGYGPVYNDETQTKNAQMTREDIRTPLPARTDAEEHVSWSHFMT